MVISNQKILSIKCVLAGISKAELSKALGVGTVTLSREITSKKLISDIENYFNSIDPKINVMVSRLLNDGEKNNYQTGNFNQAGANEQHVNYGNSAELINEKNKTIERLEGEVDFLRKMLMK